MLTPIVAVPGEATRLAVTTAVSSLALTEPVESASPFHWTIEFGRNPEPLTVNVNVGLFVTAVEGLRLVIVIDGAVVAPVARRAGPRD